MNPRLPQIASVVIPPPGPRSARCPDQVQEIDGDLSPADDVKTSASVPGRDLLGKATQVLSDALFPKPDAPPPTQDQVLWSVRVLLQFVLMYFGIRTHTPMLPHTGNAATALLPAIDCSLRFSDVILKEDPRVGRSIDFAVVSEQRNTLLDLRELWKLAQVFATCAEAGTTHVEQYLDGVARFVYKKMNDILGEDFLLQQDLEPLLRLVSDPIEAALLSKKSNVKITAAAEEKGAAQAREAILAATPAGTAAPLPTTGGATPMSAPQPAPGKSGKRRL